MFARISPQLRHLLTCLLLAAVASGALAQDGAFGGSDATGDTHQELIQSGDVLYLALPGEDGFNKNYQVNRQGRLVLPELGEITVAGLSQDQARDRVGESLAKIYRDVSRFDLTVSEHRLLVTVLGYVKQPGPVDLPGDGSVQMALNAAGGLVAGAQLDRLQIHRGGAVTTFNYKRYLDTGDVAAMPALEPLDTVFVPASPLIGNVQVDFDAATLVSSGDAAEDRNAVKIFGEVANPGLFSYRQGASAVDMLMRAGGVTRFGSVEQIRVINEGQPALFNLKEYLDTGDKRLLPQVSPGATIFVPKEQEEIKKGARTVYVMGEVFKPGAYESKPDATFMDILANAGGPTRFAETRQIRIMRADKTVEPFDMQAYTDGSARVVQPQVKPGDAIFVPEKTDVNEKSWLKVSPNRAVKVMGAVAKPGRYEWSDEMSLFDLIAHAGGPTARADVAHLKVMKTGADGRATTVTFDLDRFLKYGGRIKDVPVLRAGDVVIVPELPDDPTDNKSRWVRQSPESSIYILGQVGSPGRYAFNPDLSFIDILSAADGPTQEADLRNVRVTHRNGNAVRVTKLDLGLYFETGDEGLLPEVLPGDTIFVPERDRQWLDERKEDTVRVLGAVGKPGRYRFDDTMTLLDLLAEAGGPSPTAYVERIVVVNNSCCEDKASTFDLVNFAQSSDYTQLPVLRAGDTVYVPDKSQSNWRVFMDGVRDAFSLLSVIALLGVL